VQSENGNKKKNKKMRTEEEGTGIKKIIRR
jgi:hypothetical protein